MRDLPSKTEREMEALRNRVDRFDPPKAQDSPRWCGICLAYGDHHSDRCPVRDTVRDAVMDEPLRRTNAPR